LLLSNQLGYLDFPNFQALLHALHIEIGTFATVQKQLEWMLKDLPSELEGMSEKDAVFRFELFRRLFLERNL